MGALADRLEHSGVKGMKWGSRKSKKSGSPVGIQQKAVDRKRIEKEQKNKDLYKKSNDRNKRIIKGTASKMDKITSFNEVGFANLVYARLKYRNMPLSKAIAKNNLEMNKNNGKKMPKIIEEMEDYLLGPFGPINHY